MSEPSPIEFRLKTTADTSGAEAVEKSILDATKVTQDATKASQDGAKATQEATKAAAEATTQTEVQAAQSKQLAVAQREQAEEVKKSIFGATTAAQDATRQAEAQTVQQRQLTAVQREQAVSLREIADGQQRILAAGLAKQVKEIAGEFKGLSPEVQLCVDASGNFLETLGSTGNIAAAMATVAVTAFRAVSAAQKTADDQAKAIAERQKEDILKVAEFRAAYAAQIKKEGILDRYKDELEALTLQEQAMGRIIQLRATTRDADAARQSNEADAAVAGGASPAAVAAQQLAAGLERDLAALNDTLLAAGANAKQAEGDAIAALSLTKTLVENSPEQIQAVQTAKTAKVASDAALLDLSNLGDVTAIQTGALLDQAQQSGRAITTGALDTVTSTAKVQEDALKKEVTRLGTASSSGAREALAALSKILADGIIKPAELEDLRQAMARIRGNRESMDKTVKEAFEALSKADAALTQVVTPITRNVDALLEQNRQLASKVKLQSDQIREVTRFIEQTQRQGGTFRTTQ